MSQIHSTGGVQPSAVSLVAESACLGAGVPRWAGHETPGGRCATLGTPGDAWGQVCHAGQGMRCLGAGVPCWAHHEMPGGRCAMLGTP